VSCTTPAALTTVKVTADWIEAAVASGSKMYGRASSEHE
jgi:hypothetical protein